MASRRTLLKWAGVLWAASFFPIARAAEMPKPRLCIWAADRHQNSHVRPQRGDVVDVLDTTRHPGREVLGHPEWRIVDVDLQVDDPVRAMAWLVIPDEPVPGYLGWFRRHTVDLDYLEKLTEKRLGRRLAADDILTVSPGALRALAKVKLALPDPRIIRA